jgi:hypothetical protein
MSRMLMAEGVVAGVVAAIFRPGTDLPAAALRVFAVLAALGPPDPATVR